MKKLSAVVLVMGLLVLQIEALRSHSWAYLDSDDKDVRLTVRSSLMKPVWTLLITNTMTRMLLARCVKPCRRESPKNSQREIVLRLAMWKPRSVKMTANVSTVE